jgi:hypothetical protein
VLLGFEQIVFESGLGGDVFVNARRLGLAVLVSLSLLAGAALLGAPVALAESCPNQALRTGFNALLPECRAYELVSPPGTPPQIQLSGVVSNNTDAFRDARIQGEPLGVNVAASGERLAYYSNYAPTSSPSDSQYYMATRGPDGWSTASLTPPQTPNYHVLCHNAYAVGYSTELTSWVLGDGWFYPQECGKDEPELVRGEPQDVQNLFLSKGLSSPSQLIDVTPEDVPPANSWFQAASSGLEHVVFDERAPLTPEAPGSNALDPGGNALDLYMWTEGAVPALRLVTILPNGTPANEGVLVDRDMENTSYESEYSFGQQQYERPGAIFAHAVSSDGSRVFFRSEAEGKLYARVNAYAEQSAANECTAAEQKAEPEKACTVELDASETGGEGGGGQFMWASANGSRVFFTDQKQLTANATAAAEEPDLYEYDFEAPAGERLTDLTADATTPADVLGVSGVAENGSYVYFVADGKLTSEENSNHDTATAGQPNLYVAHAGEVAFIATLDPEYDSMDWNIKVLTTRFSANGRYIAFDSQRELTGYDNTPQRPLDCEYEGTARPCTEIFLYDAQQHRLSCVSCEPNGAPPTAPALIHEPETRPMDQDTIDYVMSPAYLQHNVTNQGQVFFDTAEPLSSRASNGLVNAYEYRDGEAQLLSTATSDVGAYFYEASPSGDDVFITTSQPLTAGAEGSEYSVYDARVDGGFVPPEPATACSEEDCRGAITPTPLLGAPSSQTLVAAGNPVYAPSSHRTVKRKKPKKKKKRNKTRTAKSRGKSGIGKKALGGSHAAHRNRGGAR